MPRARSLVLLALVLLAPALGCTRLGDDLRRAELALSEARYEDVEVWLDDLADSVPRMRRDERARYYYLAGIAAHRTGDRARARHALALCREELAGAPDALSESWKRNLALALGELEQVRP